MLVLALDTTTRAGSVALVRDETIIAAEAGNADRTHGERLPGEIMQLLVRHAVPLSAIDLFAVAAGPGSFTGLRVGIATMQGLALANGKGLIGISALDALAFGGQLQIKEGATSTGATLAVLMDAQRQEVFGAVYDVTNLTLLDGPTVASPDETLRRWSGLLQPGPVWFVGDGALAYRSLIGRIPATILEPTPLIAPVVGQLGRRAMLAGAVVAPDAIRPQYIRRPDAELARNRR